MVHETSGHAGPLPPPGSDQGGGPVETLHLPCQLRPSTQGGASSLPPVNFAYPYGRADDFDATSIDACGRRVSRPPTRRSREGSIPTPTVSSCHVPS